MKKTKKALATLAIAGMALTMVPLNAFASTVPARLAGNTAAQTAVEIADQTGWTGKAILASSASYAMVDALTAGPLASYLNAPILLTDNGNTLDTYTKAELTKLAVKTVYVTSGTAVIKQAVLDELAAMGITVVPLGGVDKFETSVNIAKKMVGVTKVAVATGSQVQDALSIAAIASAANQPILLTNKDALPASVAAYLAANPGITSSDVIGGTGVISDAVKTALPSATRHAGNTAYDTNNQVIQDFNSSLTFSNVFVANGATGIDALAGAPLAAKTKSAIVLTDGTATAAAAFVNTKLTGSSVVTALGGTAVVPAATLAGVAYQAPATLAVSSVSAINLNQFKVMFNVVVDKDTAENEANYLVGGTALVPGTDIAVLQADKQSVLVTLNTPQTQYAKTWVTVNRAVLTKDLLQTAPKIEQELVFTDTTVPTVSSVTVSGNTTVTVKFSEPLKLLAAGADATNFKLNDQSVVNYGYTSAVLKNFTAANYADGIELTFATALPAGTNTLTVPAGTGASLVDAAGFMVAKTTTSFSVGNETTAPKVTGITGMNNGTVYVTFDRSMKNSALTDGALNLTNYDIGDGLTNPTAASFKADTSNTVVKLTFAAGKVALGGNILVFDKDMVDTYGNKIDGTNDVRVSYVATEDIIKPTVASVTLTSSTKVRVKFSETVNYLYAQNLANYKLKDSSGTDISARMTSIAAMPTVNTNSDTFDISLTPGLESSNYSLTIKNVVDTAYTPKAMDEYTTTISGSDTTGPVFNVAVASTSALYKAAVYFNEAMDSSTISNVANYAFTNGLAEVKALPSGTTLNLGEGNKSVEIVFPSNYTTAAGGTALNIVAIRVANVKDAAGNILTAISTTNAVQTAAAASAAYGPAVVANSFKIYYSGTNLTAEVEFDQALNTLVLADFSIAGQTADSGYLSGKKVILTFTASAKKNAIKAVGVANLIAANAAPASTNVSGMTAKPIPATTVYSYTAAPKLIAAPVVATDGATSTVTITFDSPVDATIAGLYSDDFTFMNNTQGKVITATSNTAAGNVLTYTFADANLVLGDSITVKAVTANINIKTPEDANHVQTNYVPSTTDTNGYTVTTI